MPSPMITVAGLAVLWMLVVVPMIVQRPAGLPRGRLSRRAVRSTNLTGVASRRRGPRLREGTVARDETASAETSDARRSMMTRRRRALTLLIGGCVVTLAWAVLRGGVGWALAVAFVAALAGYLWSLRVRARRDQVRRQARETRTTTRHPRPRAMPPARDEDDAHDSVVRIDDEDLALQAMDTVDLSGLYEPDELRRRAS